MIRLGFLDPESRQDLVDLARDGSVAHRLARRANALLLLDGGMSCEAAARVLFIDDDTVRTWYQQYQEDGIEGLASFGHEGGACRLTVEQQDRLKVWISATLPRTTREVGAWIARECGIEYQTRSGLIALLHRLDMEHRKPKAISRKLDPAKQAAFINQYEALMNRIEADEAVVFADAVHPTHAVRPVGCWGPKDVPIAIEQSSGRDRLNIHGAIDLETGQTVMKDVLTVDALSTIMLLTAIEAMYPGMRFVHVFLDIDCLSNATLGVLHSVSLAVCTIGQGLATARGLNPKHTTKQVDRLLSNQGINVDDILVRWVPYVIGARASIVVALDWTDFDADNHATIMLSLITDHGRATPLVWLTVDKSTLRNHRSLYEHRVLVRLAELLPPDVKVCVVADRGFGDQNLYRVLTEELYFDYVIRFRGNIAVTAATGETRTAAAWVPPNGRARVLRGAAVTAERYHCNRQPTTAALALQCCF